jgi:hypothetical protein
VTGNSKNISEYSENFQGLLWNWPKHFWDFQKLRFLQLKIRYRHLSRPGNPAPYELRVFPRNMTRRRRGLDKTTQVVREQIAAMGAVLFEVGLFKPGAADEGQAVMIPRIWNPDTLVRSIPWLRYQNADGRNIYIRPKGEHDLNLIDDLSAGAVQRMKATGFAPAVVVETSPENFQVWLKHPTKLSREDSTIAARKLADTFGGDCGAADWRHYGRLAGFTNRKEKYASESGLFPFVRLVEATGQRYVEADRFITSVAAEREMTSLSRERFSRIMQNETRGYALKTIDDFRASPRFGGDNTRIDLAYAIYAVSHGADSAAVTAALRSRDLSHKGNEKRQDQYVERTLAKATAVTRSR